MIKEIIKIFLSKVDHLPEDVKEKIAEEFEEKTKKELNTPPKIAILGKSGVGKSTTLNSLFGTDLKTSHNKACTKEAIEIIVPTKNGDIIFYDMPGLDESMETEEQYRKLYAEVLPTCDVVIWVLMASGVGRAMRSDQEILRDVIKPHVHKLVIGINQVDKIEPENWNVKGNYPSKEQKVEIEERIKDVHQKLSVVVPDLALERIVHYSAKKGYRLTQLFSTLLNSCSGSRAWVLESRKDLKNYLDLLDPIILERLKSQNKNK